MALKRHKTSKVDIRVGRSDKVSVCSAIYHWIPDIKRLTSPVGMTETSTVVLSSAADDIWFGSSGSIFPAVEIKIMSIEGTEITGYDQPGELVVKSPSAVLGYLNNPKATRETFQDGWVRTGDEAVVRVGPKGTEHVFIVDRIKELIKVKVCCDKSLPSLVCRANPLIQL